MNYKKLLVVGFASAFVAVLTSVLGVAGTVIGSVGSSVLYNVLCESLEDPVSKASINSDFEWDIAYVFPLVVIAIIQLMLIFALLSEMGILPQTFLNVYLSLQQFANNNLYRILGIALLFISAYPLVLKRNHVKKEHGLILIFVGLIFLARGFVDMGNFITNLYDGVFSRFDLPIAVVAFVLIAVVIVRVLMSAYKSESEVKQIRSQNTPVQKVSRTQKSAGLAYAEHERKVPKRQRPQNVKRGQRPDAKPKSVRFRNDVGEGENVSQKPPAINRSSEKIQFESNDMLDNFKK